MNIMKFFSDVKKAYFIDRPNRFLVNCEFEGKVITAFLPNPGRLQELLFPGTVLYITKNPSVLSRKTDYTVTGIVKNDLPVMLHTHVSNNVVRELISKKLIPPLEDTIIAGSEVPYKNSRFDFLLQKGKEKIYLEVKSCTLFHNHVSMFPDAVTERGRRHLEELKHIAEGGIKAAVIFLIHYYGADVFSPDYHTDLLFSKTFLSCKDIVDFIPLAIKWNEDFSLSDETKVLPVPWEIIEKEAGDRGSYLLLLEIKREKDIKIGKLGTIKFYPGYYVYAGSAMKNLSQRIKRHYRLRKNFHWHIDYLREEAGVVADFPVRSSEDLECKIAASMSEISDFNIPSFGSSDCNCKSHLYGFTKNPLLSPQFINIVMDYRINPFRI
jgi:sugar fermentation stimulation protein A